MHKINLVEDVEPIVDTQKRVHPRMKDVVRKEVIRLLESGVIYPISDSKWVNHVHSIPKHGGITTIQNDKDEVLPSRTITEYKMCVDFRKLNKITIKEHQPLLFMEQIIDRITSNSYYCLLDA